MLSYAAGIPKVPRVAKFTENGTFTVPAGVFMVRLSGCGGGGGGGGASSSGEGEGGGGGCSVLKLPVLVTPGESIYVNVGVGGDGGSLYNYGSNGQNSSFGDISVPGGYGGRTAGTSRPTPPDDNPYFFYSRGTTLGRPSGTRGSRGAGNPGLPSVFGKGSHPGSDATEPGGGGAGGAGPYGKPLAAGRNGAAGLLIVEY